MGAVGGAAWELLLLPLVPLLLLLVRLHAQTHTAGKRPCKEHLSAQQHG
jgi:hypothetical protein